MSDIQVSLFGTVAHPELWPNWFKQFEQSKVNYEVVFCGPNAPNYELPPNVTFLHRPNDPGLGACSQIAANHVKGETMFLIADDCIYAPDFLDKLYEAHVRENDYKCMVYARWCGHPDGTKATGDHAHLNKEHDIVEAFWEIRTIPGRTDIRFGLPLWDRRFFFELGGYDRRFVVAPYDADMQLRAFQRGGRFVYADAYMSEPLGPESRAWNRWGGMQAVEELMFRRWYSNGKFTGGVLLPEPRTPFEPFRPGELE